MKNDIIMPQQHQIEDDYTSALAKLPQRDLAALISKYSNPIFANTMEGVKASSIKFKIMVTIIAMPVCIMFFIGCAKDTSLVIKFITTMLVVIHIILVTNAVQQTLPENLNVENYRKFEKSS